MFHLNICRTTGGLRVVDADPWPGRLPGGKVPGSRRPGCLLPYTGVHVPLEHLVLSRQGSRREGMEPRCCETGCGFLEESAHVQLEHLTLGKPDSEQKGMEHHLQAVLPWAHGLKAYMFHLNIRSRACAVRSCDTLHPLLLLAQLRDQGLRAYMFFLNI